jgi:hypothetical protein
MTGDPRAPGPRPVDDAAIEELVRDVVGGWTMPPVRLDAPSWRDRVRGPRARRLAAASGWLARAGQAATAAIALTVVAALVAVVITRPPADPGKSPEPSGGPTQRATREPEASLLPKLLVEGALPNPSELLVETGQGDFALVDLANGTIGGPLTGARYGSRVQVRADGSMVCLCLSESGNVGGSPTNAEVTLDRFDASGKLLSSTPVESLAGEPDPRDAGQVIPERPPHVLAAMGFSAGGRFGFVGWSVRAHPAWLSGVTVVDLQDGRVVSRLPLPDATTGDEDSRRVVVAPRVIGSTGDDGLLLARDWFEWTPPASESPSFMGDSEVFRARFTGGQWSDLAPVSLTGDCGATMLHGGGLPDGGTWLVCGRGPQLTVLRRITAEGGILPDVRIAGGEGIDGDTTALSPDRSALYVWDPASATLTRVDLATGETTRGEGLSARAEGGPLAALGHWLAPSAVAKSLLRGSVIVSPDGARVYAIGIKPGVDERDISGSTGVFVFDATTLESRGIWQPTADFVSLAISPDSRFVYAAGLPGVDFMGRRRVDQQASITVFDSRDGSTRLVAGELGADLITFRALAID